MSVSAAPVHELGVDGSHLDQSGSAHGTDGKRRRPGLPSLRSGGPAKIAGRRRYTDVLGCTYASQLQSQKVGRMHSRSLFPLAVLLLLVTARSAYQYRLSGPWCIWHSCRNTARRAAKHHAAERHRLSRCRPAANLSAEELPYRPAADGRSGHTHPRLQYRPRCDAKAPEYRAGRLNMLVVARMPRGAGFRNGQASTGSAPVAEPHASQRRLTLLQAPATMYRSSRTPPFRKTWPRHVPT